MPKNVNLNKSQVFGEIVVRLLQNPNGIPIASLKNEFGISDRNYRYYLDDLKNIPEFLDKNGEPMVIEEKEGDIKFLRLKPQLHEDEKGEEFYASFFMASALMNFLAGTKLYDPINHWIKTLESNGLKLPAKHLDKKFYSINEMPKDYSGKEHIIRIAIQSVVEQRKVDITYKKRDDSISHHLNFKPYTLLQYRFGLYIAGETAAGDKKGIITLALDRITEIKRAKEKFLFPADYSPAKYFSKGIGIMRGDKTHEVQLVFEPDMASLVKERRYHESAKFTTLKDGSLRMTFKVDSLFQVVSWVLSFGPLVKVKKPKELLEMVTKEIKETAQNYGILKRK